MRDFVFEIKESVKALCADAGANFSGKLTVDLEGSCCDIKFLFFLETDDNVYELESTRSYSNFTRMSDEDYKFWFNKNIEILKSGLTFEEYQNNNDQLIEQVIEVITKE